MLWEAYLEPTKKNLTDLTNFDKAIDTQKRKFAKNVCKLENTPNDRACIMMNEIMFEKTFEFKNIRKERDDMSKQSGTQHSSLSTRKLVQAWHDSNKSHEEK